MKSDHFPLNSVLSFLYFPFLRNIRIKYLYSLKDLRDECVIEQETPKIPWHAPASWWSIAVGEWDGGRSWVLHCISFRILVYLKKTRRLKRRTFSRAKCSNGVAKRSCGHPKEICSDEKLFLMSRVTFTPKRIVASRFIVALLFRVVVNTLRNINHWKCLENI